MKIVTVDSPPSFPLPGFFHNYFIIKKYLLTALTQAHLYRSWYLAVRTNKSSLIWSVLCILFYGSNSLHVRLKLIPTPGLWFSTRSPSFRICHHLQSQCLSNYSTITPPPNLLIVHGSMFKTLFSQTILVLLLLSFSDF
jgi:hypothetical protein